MTLSATPERIAVSLDVLERLHAQKLVKRALLRLPPERREAVIAAAIVEAGERGPGLMKIKQVAERAQVPVGSIYQYFGNREALVGFTCAVAIELLAETLAYADSALDDLPFARALHAYLDGALAWCRSEAALVRVYVAAAYNLAGRPPDVTAEADANRQMVAPLPLAMQQAIRSLVARAQDRGELRPDFDPERMSRLINVLVIAVVDAALLPELDAYYRLYDASLAPEDLIGTLVDFVCGGVIRPDA